MMLKSINAVILSSEQRPTAHFALIKRTSVGRYSETVVASVFEAKKNYNGLHDGCTGRFVSFDKIGEKQCAFPILPTNTWAIIYFLAGIEKADYDAYVDWFAGRRKFVPGKIKAYERRRDA